METNETVRGKGVVAFDNRKLVGTVDKPVIDCDECGVSHFSVTSSSTHATLVLPFEKTLSVGDTFVTIQNRDDLAAPADVSSNSKLAGDFELVGTEVYARNGSFLDKVASFEIDTVSGKVAKIVLEQGASFECDSYVFFSPEFVFVDDGSPTDAELRQGGGAAEETAAENEPEPGQTAGEPTADAEPEEGQTEEAAEPEATEEQAGEDPDAAVKEFLLGKTLKERVVSSDKAFEIEAGEVITEEVLEKAQAADALVLLTMSVDE